MPRNIPPLAAAKKRALDELRARDWRRPAVSILIDYVPIVLAYLYMWKHPRDWAAYLVAWCVLGVQAHRLGILGHDGAHFLLFRARWLNDLVANLFLLYPLGMTVSGYRAWHFEHHRKLGTPQDPELNVKKGWRYDMPKRRIHFAALFFLDCLGMGADEVVKILTSCGPRTRLDRFGLAGYWVTGLLAVLQWGRLDMMLVHVTASFTLLMALSRLRMWFEHSGVEKTHRIRSNPLVAYALFPHATWFHYEHHRWPGIPYYNLARARSLERDEPVLSMRAVFSFFAGSDRADSAPRSRLGNEARSPISLQECARL